MEMVGGDLFKKVVLLEKLQLLGHVVTEVCNRSLVVLKMESFCWLPWLAVSIRFSWLSKHPLKNKNQNNRSFSFLAHWNVLFGSKKNQSAYNNNHILLQEEHSLKMICNTFQTTTSWHSKKAPSLGGMFWHFFETVQILASKKVNSEVRRLDFIVRCTKILKKVSLEFIIGGVLPKGSFTFGLWRFFFGIIWEIIPAKILWHQLTHAIWTIWGILKCRNPFQMLTKYLLPTQKKRKNDVSLKKGPIFLNGKFSIVWHSILPSHFSHLRPSQLPPSPLRLPGGKGQRIYTALHGVYPATYKKRWGKWKTWYPAPPKKWGSGRKICWWVLWGDFTITIICFDSTLLKTN